MSILRRKQEKFRGYREASDPLQVPEYFVEQDKSQIEEESLPPLLRRRLGKQGTQLSADFEPEESTESDPGAYHAAWEISQTPLDNQKQQFSWQSESFPSAPEDLYPREVKPGFRARVEDDAQPYGWENSGYSTEPGMKDAARYQEDLDNKELRRQFSRERRKIIWSKLARGIQWLLIGACVYIVFLIYGVIVTSYEYDSGGNIVPQRMTVEELATAAEFREVQGYYLRARALYEKTLALDFRLANNPEAALLVASDYELLLEEVAKLSVDLNAAQLGAVYAQMHRQLLYWVQTDIAVYLQNISAAITQNSADKADQAVIGRDIMYNDFMLISENIAVYGRVVKGVSLGDIFEWSPDKYIREELEGLLDE